MKVLVLQSFAGPVSGQRGKIIEIKDRKLLKSLLDAKYVKTLSQKEE